MSADKPYCQNDSSLNSTNLLATFSLQKEAQRKSYQKETPIRGISPVATGKEGSAPSTAPPFEKGGRKLFVKMIVLTPLSAS